MLTILGYTDDEFQSLMDVSELTDKYNELTQEIDSLTELKDLKKEELEDYVQNELVAPKSTKKRNLY